MEVGLRIRSPPVFLYVVVGVARPQKNMASDAVTSTLGQFGHRSVASSFSSSVMLTALGSVVEPPSH